MTPAGEPFAEAIDGQDRKTWHLPLGPLNATSTPEAYSPGEQPHLDRLAAAARLVRHGVVTYTVHVPMHSLCRHAVVLYYMLVHQHCMLPACCLLGVKHRPCATASSCRLDSDLIVAWLALSLHKDGGLIQTHVVYAAVLRCTLVGAPRRCPTMRLLPGLQPGVQVSPVHGPCQPH
jgi:hypothetical protein